MFLLENQLLYRLLTLLISSILDLSVRKHVEESIQAFIQTMSSRKNCHRNKKRTLFICSNFCGKISHFLLRTIPAASKHFARSFAGSGIDIIRNQSDAEQNVLLQRRQPRSTDTFQSVSELKSSGIKVVKSETCSFKDVSFNQGFFMGTLRLSPLVVGDSAAVKFLNLIAFEMCPDFINESVMTAYMFFLDSLIDHVADVKELRKAKILDNILGSNEEVAKLFNEIGTDLVSDRKLYQEVNEKIENHYQSVVTAWVVEFNLTTRTKRLRITTRA